MMGKMEDLYKKCVDTIRDPKQKRHFLVGTPTKWKKHREIQIKFLKENGLESKYYLLDLGCGTLRGGIPVINFLEQGHYYGIDVRTDALEEARKELFEEKLSHKEPVLILATDLSTLVLERKFDIIWAWSVLIHLSDKKLDSCLEFVAGHLENHGTFFATVNFGDKVESIWREFPVVWRSLEFYNERASKYGLKVQDIGRPRRLGRSLGKKKDGRRMLKISKK